MLDDASTDVVLRLGEGVPDAPKADLAAPARASRLSDSDTDAVLARLPPLPREPETAPFALRDRSLPPPRPGAAAAKTVFPPSEAVGAAGSFRPSGSPGDLPAPQVEVLRHQPDGDVPLAPSLSITFSQPMVALASVDALATAEVPVRLHPPVPGRWRWIGTRTLLFEPDGGRFPMATAYRVEVPAGARSAAGGTLAAAASFSFRTPPPTLVASHPVGGPSTRQPTIVLAFDQTIDPATVLPWIRIRGAKLRLATREEVDADPDALRRSRETADGRWIAVRTEEPLPAGAEVRVEIVPGAPSAEGERRTEKVQEYSFRTFGPMEVVSHRCGWRNDCRPHTPFQFELANPIDAKRFRKEMVTAEPPIPGMKVSANGTWLSVAGRTKGRTAYRVTLSADLPDTFGQTLGRDAAFTFKVGKAEPQMSVPGGPFVVLDPSAEPTLSVFSVNHRSLRIGAWAVTPADWPSFRAYLSDFFREDAKAQPPGRKLLERSVDVAGEEDELTETRVDLAAAFPGDLGHAVVVIEPAVRKKDRQRFIAWVQRTRIGLDAFSDATQLLAFVTNLTDGSALAGVELSLGPETRTTDAGGLATVPLTMLEAPVLVARRGGDVAILPRQVQWWGSGGWQRAERPDALRFVVFDDRGMYRPGEEVRVKGWVRRVGLGPQGDVVPLLDDRSARTGVGYRLVDSQGNEIDKGTQWIGPAGGFDLTLKLPPTMNLGTADLEIEGPSAFGDHEHHHPIEVQEFRRPEFEVAAEASEGPHFVGGHATASVRATYYAGGALAGAETSWRVTARRATFVPPNRDGWTFGTFVPWWESHGDGGEVEVETYEAKTGGDGAHHLRVDVPAVRPPQPTQVTAEATVLDVNRQAWSASASWLVHPAELYVGLRTARTFVQAGAPIAIEAIVTDLDGKAIGEREIAIVVERMDWEPIEGEWRQVARDPQNCSLRSGTQPVACAVKPKEGGLHRITALVADAEGRPNRSRHSVWVAGGKAPPRRTVERETVTLIPDKREYRAGETAEVLVLAPWEGGEAVMTLRRSGIVRAERFAMKGVSHTVKIPIEEGFTPNVHVQVDVVGSAPRTNDDGEVDPTLPERPAFAGGSLSLPIPARVRTLSLEVTPRDRKLEPGGETEVEVVVTDAAGRPVAGSEVALVVVDEAVLSLSGYRTPDPIATLYRERDPGVDDHHLRESILLARPDDVLLSPEPRLNRVPGGARAKTRAVADAEMEFDGVVLQESFAGAPMAAPEPGGPQPAIRMRTDFSALAFFAAALPTDSRGRVDVAVKLPDNLTRYRVMAVAAARRNEFGKGESAITARLPLMVRPSPPRFSNFGDRFELPVVVQNQTDAPLEVDVAVRASNLRITAGAGRRVTVPANDRAEVRFPAAADRAGRVHLQVAAAASGSGSRDGAARKGAADAAEVKWPVWTPATTEGFATYGTLDEAGAVTQPVVAPAGSVKGFGGLEVTTSSTALQALTDAVLYLVSYPFECSEQLASRVLSIAALRDVLAAFEAEGLPEPAEIVAAVERDLERLVRLQNDDGGFAFWRRGDDSWPYLSIHVAHAFARAQEKGFAVPEPARTRALGYLRSIEQRIPSHYGIESRRALIAYALSVRSLYGDADPGRARALLRESGGAEKTPLEGLAWILPVLHRDPGSRKETDAILRHLGNRVVETAGNAHFAVSYGDGAHLLLHSDRRADALVLDGLIGADPRSDLIPKLVSGLLAHRKAGRWGNTQENVFVLLALDRYFQAFEKATPDFVARAWLGERYAGEHAFKGRTTERHHVEIPLAALPERGTTDLIVAKEGAGRLYYRVGLRYAPDDLTPKPYDAGFTVERVYEGVDDPDDVRRDADGTWRVKAGRRVRVKLTMVAPSRRYHVALVDPLPAGLEALNPALATTGALPPGPDPTVATIGGPGFGDRHGGHWWIWLRPWYDHQNLRDERAEAFSALVWEGVWSYAYVARATTPGTFVVPPPKAEEMYAPETFGRGAGDRMIVE